MTVHSLRCYRGVNHAFRKRNLCTFAVRMNDAEEDHRGGISTFENVTYAHMCVNGNTDYYCTFFPF